jgi:PKD repeat protein
VTFAASADAWEGPIWSGAEYAWDLDGSGEFATATGTTPSVSTTFADPGTYPIGLRVTGAAGLVATSSTNYVVTASTASISGPARVLTGEAATFDASASAVPGGTITKFVWDFGDSDAYATDTGTTPSASHVFDTPGTYRVKVHVTRQGGRVDETSMQVEVLLRPPDGYVGVSINNGDYAVNTPKVTLSVVWPAYAGQALVSNDGGFGAPGNTTLVPIATQIPWTLRTEASERLPKTVYLRFPDSDNSSNTFTDDIILDTTQPVVQDAQVVSGAGMTALQGRQAGRVFRVRLKASQRRSGVSVAQLSRSRSGGVKVRLKSRTVRGVLQLSRVISVRLTVRPRYVRVQSAAGTWSTWRRIR